MTISSQKLGMTVENVLERTVVRAAAPGGGAEAAGVETGSLLVALDGKSTKVRREVVRRCYRVIDRLARVSSLVVSISRILWCLINFHTCAVSCWFCFWEGIEGKTK